MSVPEVVLSYPFRGRWLARNSPARRVPSHGTDLMGTTYAIDFIAVDERGKSAPWHPNAVIGTEPPERFAGFGQPVLAPCAGTVVEVHDGEEDHAARRSQLTLLGYMLTQAQRLREGPAALAGNYVAIETRESSAVVLVAHLRRGSISIEPGESVERGRQIGRCGNSGNSTQPHVHLQATDSREWRTTRGLPMRFDIPGLPAMPGEGEIVVVE